MKNIILLRSLNEIGSLLREVHGTQLEIYQASAHVAECVHLVHIQWCVLSILT